MKSTEDLQIIGLALVNTTLCPAAAAITYFALAFLKQEPDLGGILNSTLGGLVAITACCNEVKPWAAVIIGVGAGFVYLGSSLMLKMLKIDDVIDAAPVHYFCGIWGVLATGLFGTSGGLFYGDADGPIFIQWQIAGILVITLWTAGITAAFMGPLHFMGMLRISEEHEKKGLDKMMEDEGKSPITTPKAAKTKALKDPAMEVGIQGNPVEVVKLELVEDDLEAPMVYGEKSLNDQMATKVTTLQSDPHMAQPGLGRANRCEC